MKMMMGLIKTSKMFQLIIITFFSCTLISCSKKHAFLVSAALLSTIPTPAPTKCSESSHDLLIGQVIDQDGKPIPGVNLLFHESSEVPKSLFSTDSWSIDNEINVSTDHNGQFSVYYHCDYIDLISAQKDGYIDIGYLENNQGVDLYFNHKKSETYKKYKNNDKKLINVHSTTIALSKILNEEGCTSTASTEYRIDDEWGRWYYYTLANDSLSEEMTDQSDLAILIDSISYKSNCDYDNRNGNWYCGKHITSTDDMKIVLFALKGGMYPLSRFGTPIYAPTNKNFYIKGLSNAYLFGFNEAGTHIFYRNKDNKYSRLLIQVSRDLYCFYKINREANEFRSIIQVTRTTNNCGSNYFPGDEQTNYRDNVAELSIYCENPYIDARSILPTDKFFPELKSEYCFLMANNEQFAEYYARVKEISKNNRKELYKFTDGLTNPFLPQDILRQFVNDEDSEIVLKAMDNPMLSRKMLSDLTHHKNLDIRVHARELLEIPNEVRMFYSTSFPKKTSKGSTEE